MTDRPAGKVRLMIELRRAGILDARVLDAIEKTPREMFVDPALRSRAYENAALPIGNAQAISQPYIVALMTEKLALTGREKVLEIGTGSGYQAAILARLARQVFTVERHHELAREARQRFAALGLGNVVARLGDGSEGWLQQAPFDRIIVTAAARHMPSLLIEQLVSSGIMVLPVGADTSEQRLVRVRRGGAGRESNDEIEELSLVRFVPLVAGLPQGAAEIDEPHDDLAYAKFALK